MFVLKFLTKRNISQLCYFVFVKKKEEGIIHYGKLKHLFSNNLINNIFHLTALEF